MLNQLRRRVRLQSWLVGISLALAPAASVVASAEEGWTPSASNADVSTFYNASPISITVKFVNNSARALHVDFQVKYRALCAVGSKTQWEDGVTPPDSVNLGAHGKGEKVKTPACSSFSTNEVRDVTVVLVKVGPR